MIITMNQRTIIEMDLIDINENVEFQNLVLKSKKSDGSICRIDIGRLCYTTRDKDTRYYVHASEKYKTVWVDNNSLSLDRVQWFKKYTMYTINQGFRLETIRETLYSIKYFFDFCDFEDVKPISFDALIKSQSNYQKMIYQKKNYSSSTLYKKIQRVRDFIQVAFDLSDAEILTLIPSYRQRSSKSDNEFRVSSLDDLQKYIQTCIVIFNQFSDAILKKQYPVDVSEIATVNKRNHSLFWYAPSKKPRELPSSLINNNELMSFEDLEPFLFEYFKRIDAKKDFYKKVLLFNKEEWLINSLCYSKRYAYNLCVYCFFRIYLAFTAANAQPTLDLKISDIDINKIGTDSFAQKQKYRASKKVNFTASIQLKRILMKFLELRKWVSNLGLNENVDEYLFVTISENQQLKRLTQMAGRALMLTSPLFSEVNPVTVREIRNLAGEYIVQKSGGKLSLVAKKLNNTISTVAKSYTSTSLETQAIEMNNFHEELSSKICRFNRDTEDDIDISVADNSNSFRIAIGSCTNLINYEPVKVNGFNEYAPEPTCGTFESCLFCQFYSIHIDFEDLHKLLSLREALLKTSIIRNDAEHHLAVVEPMIFRIEEITNVLKSKDNNCDELLDSVEEKIEMGIYNENWDAQIKAMNEAIINMTKEDRI